MPNIICRMRLAFPSTLPCEAQSPRQTIKHCWWNISDSLVKQYVWAFCHIFKTLFVKYFGFWQTEKVSKISELLRNSAHQVMFCDVAKRTNLKCLINNVWWFGQGLTQANSSSFWEVSTISLKSLLLFSEVNKRQSPFHVVPCCDRCNSNLFPFPAPTHNVCHFLLVWNGTIADRFDCY